MVLEYVDRGSLDRYLSENEGDLSDNSLLRMVFDVIKGMIYLQTKKIIHRDIAARNMLVDDGGVVKVTTRDVT